jgi:HSP20 family protein
MSLVRYNPFRDLKPVTVDSIFDDFFGRSVSDFIGTEFVSTTPSVNIIESDNNYTIEVAAPGLNKSDFNLSLDKDQLTISAMKENKEESKDGKWSRKEFSFKRFKRSFHISDDIDQDSISANYDNGILSVVLNKKEEAKPKAPTTIEIS